MTRILIAPVLFVMIGCASSDLDFERAYEVCHFGRCISSEKLYPNPSNKYQEASLERAKEYGIDVVKAIEPIVEDVLERDGNWGLPLGYDRPKHHYHFFVLGREVDVSKFSGSFPELVRQHSAENCPHEKTDQPNIVYFSTFNRLYGNGYIFGSRGGGADIYGIVKYNPKHRWKTWPQLIETDLSVIYD